MNNSTTVRAKFPYLNLALLIFLLSLNFNSNAQSVPVYATAISSEAHVDFSTNSIDGNLTTKARIRASSGIAIGIGSYSGHLELAYPELLPANTTSYVRIDTDDNLLPSLLGGSLGNLLSDVLGTVLVGNQEFSVQVKNGSTILHQGHSQINSDFSNDHLRIVVNELNQYFIAITPDQPYNSIRLINRVGSLVGLNNTKRLDVYGAFYIATADVCGGPVYTSYDGSGLNLDLLGVGGAGVTNPHHVLDSNPSNFSKLSLGIISTAGFIEQTIYFEGLSAPTDTFKVKLKVDSSLVALGAANSIQVLGYNDATLVYYASLNSLLNLDLLTLLQGNQVAEVPFSPNVPVNRIAIRYHSLLNVQLTQSLDLYEVNRSPAIPQITDAFTLAPKVCTGSAATLQVITQPGTELKWYLDPTGGSSIATTQAGDSYVTPLLNTTTSYYVSAKKIGCPEESQRLVITIVVVPLPVASDIQIASSHFACNGTLQLQPTSTIGGVTFNYYKDSAKTIPVITGYSGDAGVSYVVDPINGSLAITGLNEVDSPYTYYISVVVDGICENAVGTLKEVTVQYTSSLLLEVTPTLTGCGSINLKDAILNFDNSGSVTYQFFDSDLTILSEADAQFILESGTYSIQSSTSSTGCTSTMQQVVVTVNEEPTLTLSSTTAVVELGNTYTLTATSTGSVVWYASDGTALDSELVGPFTTAGTYTYTAVATLNNCIRSLSFQITVLDTSLCPPLSERDYATMQSWNSIVTGGVTNANAAVDGDPSTHSTLITGLGLLGIGTTWQTLQWEETIQAGTPVYVKLGSDYGGLIIAGAYSIVGTKRNSEGIPIAIGTLEPISGSLASLLPGANTFEYSFVPTDATGPKAYDGIRIVVGSLVSVSQQVNVYEAYYKKTVTEMFCYGEDVKDVFYGAIDLGVGVTTATVGVVDVLHSVDSDVTSFATMFNGIGVLSAAELMVLYHTPTVIGDSLELILSKPSTVLDLNLLSGLTLQLYMGHTPVGAPIDLSSSLLSLTLINGGAQARLILTPTSTTFDGVQIRFGGGANVLDSVRVHTIKRIANTAVVGADETNTLTACPSSTLTLTVPSTDCTTYLWYDAATDGNVLATGSSYTLPEGLTSGTYTYYIQPLRYGCPFYERGMVTVNLGTPAPVDAITVVEINGAVTTSVCSTATSVTLEAILSTTLTLTNPTFYWYVITNSTPELIVGATTSQLVLSDLSLGTHTYAVGISTDTYCVTSEGDRFVLVFTVLPANTPEDVICESAWVCNATPAVLTPSSAQTNPSFFWYFTNDFTQPITDGIVVDGATFSAGASGEVSISGLSMTGSPYTFYLAMESDEKCLNEVGNLKPVQVHIIDSETPTTSSTLQEFCLSDAPTLASVQVNETNIVWYDLPVGGTLLPATTPLVNGTTYYTSFDASTGCSTSDRLAIDVTVIDLLTPTTNNVVQSFCLSTQPIVSDIQVNEASVLWYSTQDATEPLTGTEPLVDGATYYVAQFDASNGCESSNRLAITVTVTDISTPSTQDAVQDFCVQQAPTVLDLQVNESDVLWYDSASSTAALDSNTPLVNTAFYYASLVDALTGCESSERLEVQVLLHTIPTPTTTDLIQNFCSTTQPTVGDLQVNESNVVWYDSETGGNQLVSTTLLSLGFYYASLLDASSGCESSIRLAVEVQFQDLEPIFITGGSDSLCVLEVVTYTTNSGMTNYVWTFDNATLVAGGQSSDDSITLQWNTIGLLTLGVSYTTLCGTSESLAIEQTLIACSDLVITKTVSNATPNYGDTIGFTITVTNTGTGTFENIIVNEQLPSGYLYISSTTSTGTYSPVSGIWTIPQLLPDGIATLVVQVKVIPDGDYLNTAQIETSISIDSDPSNNIAQVDVVPVCIIVYNEFTPNGDGANDLFIIDCIENFPDNKIEVYNRYGRLVYRIHNYLNTWDGTANVSGVFKKDEKLPSGTYYYIIDLGNEVQAKTGWLSIVR